MPLNKQIAAKHETPWYTMPKLSKARSKAKARLFSKAIVDGNTQKASYLKAFPESTTATAESYASTYANKPEVVAMVEVMERALTKESAEKVAKGIMRDAVKATKEVVLSDGTKISAKDNVATIQSRDQYLRLIGHQNWVKNTNINIDNRQISIDSDTALKLIDSIDKLAVIDVTPCDQDGYEDGVIVD